MVFDFYFDGVTVKKLKIARLIEVSIIVMKGSDSLRFKYWSTT